MMTIVIPMPINLFISDEATKTSRCYSKEIENLSRKFSDKSYIAESKIIVIME